MQKAISRSPRSSPRRGKAGVRGVSEAGVSLRTMASAVLLLLGMAADTPGGAPGRPPPTVGCYYFPGHFSAARWSPMKAFGRPKPLLGYYRDALPEVLEWQNEWAAESGVRFWIFDWYYDLHSGRVSGHNAALDKGFLNARNRDRLAFCVMWCNEGRGALPPYTDAQLVRMAGTLGKRYFAQPNYFRIGGRPVVFISRPYRFIDGPGKHFRDLQDRLAQAAGLEPGRRIFWVANAPERLAECAETGFDAVSAYNYAGANLPANQLRGTYRAMTDGYEAIWKRIAKTSPLPYIPPVSPGWDSRPWYGPKAMVRTGATPTGFDDMCRRVLPYVNPELNLVVVECWNEFGEGSYIEPTEHWRFGWLDVLRKIFAPGSPAPNHRVPDATARKRLDWPFVPNLPARELRTGPGNRLVDPGMESLSDWLTYDGNTARFVRDQPHDGESCVQVPGGSGVKPRWTAAVGPGESVTLSVFVRCAPGAVGSVHGALFDRNGHFLGKYFEVGKTQTSTWTRISRTFRNTRSDVRGINLEVTARGGPVFADSAAIQPVPGTTPRVRPLWHDTDASPSGWIGFEKEPAVREQDDTGRPCLLLRAGHGIKTRRLFHRTGDTPILLRFGIRCRQEATVEVWLSLFDRNGKFTGKYTGSMRYSWPTWREIRNEVALPEHAQAFRVEFLARGGDVMLRGVQVDSQVPAQRVRHTQ